MHHKRPYQSRATVSLNRALPIYCKHMGPRFSLDTYGTSHTFKITRHIWLVPCWSSNLNLWLVFYTGFHGFLWSYHVLSPFKRDNNKLPVAWPGLAGVILYLVHTQTYRLTYI